MCVYRAFVERVGVFIAEQRSTLLFCRAQRKTTQIVDLLDVLLRFLVSRQIVASYHETIAR